MQKLDSEQIQFLVAFLMVLAFVAGYAVRAAISQLRRWHYYGGVSAGQMQRPASSFNTQSAGISRSSQASSSPEAGLNEAHVPVETGQSVETRP
jgi:hypothetical protein